jgi:hypothetical protein
MKPIFRNIAGILTGLIIGSVVNMGIITISGSIIPPPNGADVTTMEGLKATMHLFEPKHFIFPFLAHSFGTFVGAFLAALIATNRKMNLALTIGFVFLIGGIANVCLLPSPIWYSILDIAGAYIPFAYVAGKWAMKK